MNMFKYEILRFSNKTIWGDVIIQAAATVTVCSSLQRIAISIFFNLSYYERSNNCISCFNTIIYQHPNE